MTKIDVRNGKLINALTGESLGDRMIVKLMAVQKVRFFENTEYTEIDLQVTDTGESYFILPDEYTCFSLRYAAYVLGSRGRTATDTPLILKVNNKGQMEFNFDLRLRLPQLQKISA